MKLFLIKQSINNDYDTYDSAVVAAPDGEIARLMQPRNGELTQDNDQYNSWTEPENVSVTLLGDAEPGISQGVICASYNAG